MPEIERRLLQAAPVEGAPGYETRLYLITYPPGADSNGHSHPVIGIGMVLAGTIVSAFGDDAEESFAAGRSFRDRVGVHRVSRNGSATEPVTFVIAYTVREGEPVTIVPSTDA